MVYISAGGKSLIIIKGPGKPISTIGCQVSSLGTEGDPSMVIDHDTDNKVKAVPSILLTVVIPYE